MFGKKDLVDDLSHDLDRARARRDALASDVTTLTAEIAAAGNPPFRGKGPARARARRSRNRGDRKSARRRDQDVCACRGPSLRCGRGGGGGRRQGWRAQRLSRHCLPTKSATSSIPSWPNCAGAPRWRASATRRCNCRRRPSRRPGPKTTIACRFFSRHSFGARRCRTSKQRTISAVRRLEFSEIAARQPPVHVRASHRRTRHERIRPMTRGDRGKG